MAEIADDHDEMKSSLLELRQAIDGLDTVKTHTGRVQGYSIINGLLEKVESEEVKRKSIRKHLKALWQHIQLDMVSSHEDMNQITLIDMEVPQTNVVTSRVTRVTLDDAINTLTLGSLLCTDVSQSLKVLGFCLKFTELPDTEASKFLLTLLAIITTANTKLVCTLGLWCISVQEFSAPLLAMHLKMIVAAVVHGIDNPLGSMGITYEAFQALTQLTKQLPREMHDLSSTWAPPVYHKLVNCNVKIVDLAEKCLRETESVLLPPSTKLSEVVATDIQQRLLAKMESMIKLEGRPATIAVQAWGWLVRLLGLKSAEEKSLINEMLQLLETSFVSSCAQVRNASQLAWVSIIDAFLPSQDSSWSNGRLESQATESAAQSSHKRLKLLMTPLLTTMSWEKDFTVQRSCCSTWIYFLCKLGHSVNDRSIFETSVVPMIEVVFKLGPKNRDGSVWQTCVELLKTVTGCKSVGDTAPDGRTLTPRKVNHSPKTPIGTSHVRNLSSSHEAVQWSPWGLDRLNSLLKMVRLLWTCALDKLSGITNDDEPGISATYNLRAASDCWRLLVKGVETEERGTIRPSNGHITAVHLLLEFFAEACKGCPSEQLLSGVWELAETLIGVFRSIILASSFYKIQLPLAELAKFVADESADILQRGDSSLPGMVTPIVYMSAAWFKLVFQTPPDTHLEDLLLQRIHTLVTTGRSGFDVMGNYHGFAWILDCLAKGSSSFHEDSPSAKLAPKTEVFRIENWKLLLAVWRTVADQLREHIERINDVPPLGGCVSESGYQVVSTVLLFPVKCFISLSLEDYHESKATKYEKVVPSTLRKFGSFEAELPILEGSWFKLYDAVSRISSLKSPRSNLFTGGFFHRVMKVLKSTLQERAHKLPGKVARLDYDGAKISIPCLKLFGDVVAHAIKHAEVSSLAMLAISRKRRKTGLGASSVRVQYMTGMELEDANHLRDLLMVASKLLTLCYEKHKLEKGQLSASETMLRVLGALTSISQHISSQNDSVLLLQALSQPMTCWLSVIGGADSEGDLPRPAIEALAQAWDGLLSCLQACRPCLTFDSSLLNVQAPSLVPAFLHCHDAIANRTLAFWEATYGSKALSLRYPPALVEVFSKFKQKVSISLPNWTSGSVTVKQRLQEEAPANFPRHPLGRFIQQSASQDRLRSVKLSADNNCTRPEDVTLVSPLACPESAVELSNSAVGCSQRFVAVDLKLDADKHAAADCVVSEGKCGIVEEPQLPSTGATDDSLLNDCETECSQGSATMEEFVMMVDSALKEVPQESSGLGNNTSPAFDAATKTTKDMFGKNWLEDELHGDGLAHGFPDSFIRTCPNFECDGSQLDADREPCPAVVENLHEPEEYHIGVDGVDEVTRTGPHDNAKYTPTSVTPPVTICDIPCLPPKMPIGAERPQPPACACTAEVTISVPDPVLQGSQPCSNLPRRRKKLKFQDDSQDVEYTVIPATQKTKSLPLTDRQKEVRYAQRSGRVGKTYTSADFSQSLFCDEVVDYEHYGEVVTDEVGAKCKENISSNLPRIQECKPSEGPQQMEEIESLTLGHENPDLNSGKRDHDTSHTEEFDLPQLKERLMVLYQAEPSLTFRQIVRNEQYDRLPRQILKKLKKHLENLKSSKTRGREENSALDDAVVSKSGQVSEVQEPWVEETNPVDVEEERTGHVLQVEADPERETKYDANVEERRPDRHSPLQRCSTCPVDDREESAVEIPASRPLRRKPEVQLQNPRSVSLRSSGKLRGGKHWRLNSEVEKACTLRPGNKKVIAKRQRLVGANLMSDDKKACGAPSDEVQVAVLDLVVDKNCADKCPGSLREGLKSCSRKGLEGHQVLDVQESQPGLDQELQDTSAHLDGALGWKPPRNSPFRVRKLNRGILASVFGAVKNMEPAGETQFNADTVEIQGNVPTRPNHNPRKCKIPKRMPTLHNIRGTEKPSFTLRSSQIGRVDEVTTSREIGVTAGSFEVDPTPPISASLGEKSYACAPAVSKIDAYGEKGDSHRPSTSGRVPQLSGRSETLTQEATGQPISGTPEFEGTKILLSSRERQHNQRGVYGELPRRVDALAGRESPARISLDERKKRALDEASGCGIADEDHPVHTVNKDPLRRGLEETEIVTLAGTSDEETSEEIQRLLGKSGLRVSEVLAALVRCKKWGAMERKELLVAEKLVLQLNGMLGSLTGRSVSPLFVTPPTQLGPLS